MEQMSVTRNFLSNLLSDFQESVNKGKSEKIDYNTWKVLHNYTKYDYDSNSSIYVTYDISRASYCFVIGENFDNPKYIFYFPTYNEKGFGRYLKNTYHFAEKMYNEAWDNALESKGVISSLNSPVLSSNLSVTSSISNKVDLADYHAQIEEIQTAIADINKKIDKRSNEKMKGFNFDFGSCANNSNIRMSMYGLAVQNAMGSWVSYDPNAGKIIDVDIMNFDNCGQYLFKMPVAIGDVKSGDIIIHNRKAMFITNVDENGKITAIDPHASEEKIIVPTTSPFGFNFVTKIVSMFDAMTGVSPTPAAPFGNMLPFLMAENDGDIDPMMMALMMNGGQMDFSNPMLMYMLCKNEDKMSNMLPLMFMMSSIQKQ